MFEYVDPFIGTDATDLPAAAGPRRDLVVAQAAGRQHPPRRHLPVRHGLGLRLLGRLSHRLRPLRDEHRGRAAPAATTSSRPPGSRHFQQSGTGAIRKYYNYFRVTPMLEPLDALGTLWDARATRSPSPGYYAATLSLGHPLRAHRRPEAARSTATRSRPTATPGSSSTSRSAAWPSRTARTVPLRAHLATRRARRRPGRDRRRGRAAGRAPRVRRRRLAPDALVRPAADARRHPARLRPRSGRRRCGRSG